MMRKLFLLSTLFLLFALSSILVSAHAERPDPQLHHEAGATSPALRQEYAPSRLLVKFRAGIGPLSQINGAWQTGQASLDRLLASNEIQSARPLFAGVASEATLAAAGLDQIYLLHVGPGRSVAEAVQVFAVDPGVEWAEPDYLAYPIDTTPNDPLFADQWGLAKIQAPAAWDTVTGASTVPIAIVDSGIEFTHPDLSAKLWVNPGEIADNSIDDDNNGYVDDVNGWDFVNGDNAPSDDHGHGTQVAGVAAAASNNGLGVAGVCWECQVMPVKVMQASGVANYSDIAQGVLYAAQKGARVINLSLGGYSYSSALHAAVQAATGTYDAVVVAGAGNDGVDTPFYPGAYPEVLAVAGTDETDAKAVMSNFGNWADVSAPAVAITTTFAGGDWGPAEGTSFATAFVSGVAGLVRSQQPAWSEILVGAQILHTADPIDALNPGYTGLLGSGRLNAATAVTAVPHPMLTLIASTVDGDPQGRPVPGESSSLGVTLSNDWLDAAEVTGMLTTSDPYVTIGEDTTSFGSIAAGSTSTGSPLFAFSVAAGAGYNHPIPFNLHVTADGGAYVVDLPITITTRSADELVGGTIAVDTTWTNDRRYIVDSNVGVAPGVILTIEAGTEVRFNGNYSLNVGGTLIADGTGQDPIRFLSNSDADWGTIYFDDTSPDAQVDINYDYVDGSILRHVWVKNTAGIACNNSTPYLSFVDLNGGVGLECTPGTLTVGAQVQPQTAIVLDSRIEAYWVPCGIIIHGGAYLRGTEVAGDILVEITGPGTVLNNLIHGGIGVGSDSFVHKNTAANIIAGANSVAQENVAGSIWMGPHAQVLSNTVTSGAITVDDRSQVHANSIESTWTWAIRSSGIVTATNNQVVGGGIQIGGGLVEGNLIAHSIGTGLEINGSSTVISNSITGSAGTAIKLLSATSLQITHNNLEGNMGQYDVENLIAGTILGSISTQNNWWGTINTAIIDQRIFDANDDYSKGTVLYDPTLTGPEQDAPAYVRSVTLTPESPVGIETVTFEVEFSRPMDQGIAPELSFHWVKCGTWTVYNTLNSALPGDNVNALATDPDGSYWFGTDNGAAHFDGSTWTVYNSANSGLPADAVQAIRTDPDGSHWFGTIGGVARFDGTAWTVYNRSNSGLPSDDVRAIATDPDGSHWFGTDGGVAHFDGSTWTVYNPSNSGLPSVVVHAVATDPDGSHWFGTGNGAAYFDGNNWTVYNLTNSGLPDNVVNAIAADPDGSHWFGTIHGAAHFDGTHWTVYDTSNSGLPGDYVPAIATDPDGSHWFGTGYGAAHFDGNNWTVYDMSNSGLPANWVPAITTDPNGSHWFGTQAGVAVLWHQLEYRIGDNSQWLDGDTYQATYDITTLIPRGNYLVDIAGAVGTDGIEIAPTVGFTFTVDYAGAIGDTTPPPMPTVEACASTEVGTLSASWLAYDPNSAITLYRYAIGTTPGGTEVINWTDTPDPSFTRAGLGLVTGQTYYVAVKARNEGGLWSEAGIPEGIVAGSGLCTTNNDPPVADAGVNQEVLVDELVTLDGSGSYDPDGHLPLAYSWQQSGGPAVTLNGPATEQPSFTAPAVPAILKFTLVVTDVLGLADPTPDEVVITVTEPEEWYVYLPVVSRNQ